MAKEKKIKSKRPKAEPPKGFRDYFGDEINKRNLMLQRLSLIHI